MFVERCEVAVFFFFLFEPKLQLLLIRNPSAESSRRYRDAAQAAHRPSPRVRRHTQQRGRWTTIRSLTSSSLSHRYSLQTLLHIHIPPHPIVMPFILFFLLAHIMVNTSPMPVLVLATSSISVPIPLSDQLPPIACVDKPYSWTFAKGTFQSARNATLVYSASALPDWLSFDSATRTISGRPALDDEGTPRITVKATDPETSDSAYSSLSLCVTPNPPSVILSNPLSSQFKNQDNPSLGSVFVLSDSKADVVSALHVTQNPTLRIPPGWSFSIGFDGDTFTGMNDIRYAVLQADGSPLPSWITFNSDEITLNGVTPPLDELSSPYLTLALHVSDLSGFSIASELFDVVIAAHELYASTRGLPSVNITSSTTLDVLFNSQIYFDGVFVDGAPLDLQNLVLLEIDVSRYTWLHYDAYSRRLTGQLPSDFGAWNATVLPVVLNTVYNQTLRSQVNLASVASYFLKDPLPQISVGPGKEVNFHLTPFLSNATLGDVDLTTSYEPSDASSYLHFDKSSAVLSGPIPSWDKIDYSLVTVSFYAYSYLTHSTSHTSLPISFAPTDHEHTQPTTGSASRGPRKRLALGLGIALALLGGLLVLGLLLAALRCFARPPDPALTGEAATHAMTESDRQWYGIGDAGQAEYMSNNAEKGFGVRTNRQGELGIGPPCAMTFASSNDERLSASPGQLSKAEFLGRLRSTVRKVSNRYRSARKSAISRPVLVLEAGDPRILGTPLTPAIPALSGYEPMGYSGTTSSLRASPSSSTGERSIPQRRADFAPPRVPAPAPVAIHVPSRSLDSDISLASDSSTRTHAAEAVVQRAARARSVYGASGGQKPRVNDDENHAGRARVVPFTAGRMPAPHGGTDTGVPPPARASSLSASVVRPIVPPSRQQEQPWAVGASEADELHVGLRYVRALGEDTREGSGSFSSLESSSRPARSSLGSGGAGAGAEVLRVLVRVGERFRFRLPIRIGTGATGAGGGFTARRVTGELLPAFLYADLEVARGDNQKHRDTVKFWGVPRADDIGDVHVGVYTANGVCVGEAVVEVLIRSG
jgi:axial budding pattern protein 2